MGVRTAQRMTYPPQCRRSKKRRAQMGAVVYPRAPEFLLGEQGLATSTRAEVWHGWCTAPATRVLRTLQAREGPARTKMLRASSFEKSPRQERTTRTVIAQSCTPVQPSGSRTWRPARSFELGGSPLARGKLAPETAQAQTWRTPTQYMEISRTLRPARSSRLMPRRTARASPAMGAATDRMMRTSPRRGCERSKISTLSTRVDGRRKSAALVWTNRRRRSGGGFVNGARRRWGRWTMLRDRRLRAYCPAGM
mmetsp:Transcript_10256/g.31337  ORF Transcript_10256/g.31337 Transcript_10256/m.31337 type:complete len:252 (-) Transcript_10256:1575-2330(-)